MFESVRAKIVLYSAAAAFAVSILTGLIAGVSIGTAVLRALIAGVLFAGGVLLARTLIERYMPELLTLMSGERYESPQSGSGIDISIGDDEEQQSTGSGSELRSDSPVAASTSGGLFDESLIEEVDESPLDDNPVGGASAFDEAESIGEASDEGKSLPELEGLGAFEPGLEAEQVSSSNDGGSTAGAGAPPDAGASDDDDGPDDLDFLDNDPVSRSTSDSASGSEGGDPKMMAEAIRTVLKREDS